MTTNKRGSGRADPSDAPIIKRRRSKASEQQQDAPNAPSPTCAVVDYAAKHAETENKPSSNVAQNQSDAQHKATDDVEEEEVGDEPTDENVKGEKKSPTRHNGRVRHSYHDAHQKKFGDQRVARLFR